MIPKDIIQSILEISRIDEVVSEFVNLKKRGTNLIGLCPFHNEKTPSFTVSPTKGIYKCFGCGKAGNSVNFVMEHEHYTYPEALRFLAKKYHIEIEEQEPSPEMILEQNEKDSLYNMHSFALSYFSDFLHNQEEGRSIGLSYLQEREFSDEAIQIFQLGYCGDNRNRFTQHATNNGYHLQSLVKSGLTIEKDNEYYDRFRGRIIFPIHNLTGRAIGFGARILKNDTSKPKYINSPESDIYSKSKVLYGLFFAKNTIISLGNCYLVEGYTDVISLFQSGVKNVVASSGTSLTVDQIKLIKRFTNNITILYDGDEAGLKASFRGIDLILEQGMNVRIVLFPEGEDPDSFARKHRPAELKAYLSNQAKDFIRLKTELLLGEVSNDPVKKAGLIREVLSSVAIIPDSITRSVYLKECARLLTIEENTLVFELNRLLREKFKTNLKADPTEIPLVDFVSPVQNQEPVENKDSSEHQERALIRLLFLYGSNDIYFDSKDEFGKGIKMAVNIAKFVINDLSGDEVSFENALFQKVFDEFKSLIDQGKIPTDHYFTSHSDHEIRNLAIEQMSTSYELSENWKKHKIYVNGEEQKLREAITSSILALKAKRLKKLLSDTEKSLRTETNEMELNQLMKKYKMYKNLLDQINKALGRVITS